MIDKLANQIAQWNRRELKLTETESKVIEFGLGVFLDVCVKFLILFMISVLIGKEVEFALCLWIKMLGRRSSLPNKRDMLIGYDCFMFY